MNRSSEAIVLRTMKYQENHLIASAFTRAYGIQRFIIKGYHSARSRRKHSYFQPLSIIDVEYTCRNATHLHKVSESKLNHLLQTVQMHPVKLSLGLAMVEIFYDTVKEEETNEPLYEFLRSVIVELDQAEQQLIHLFIFFLTTLTRFLGFFPLDESQGARYVQFDIPQGVLRPALEADPAIDLLRQFLQAELHTCQRISLDTATKRALITTIFEYYRHHIEGFRYPQTLRVFAEIFH